MCTRVLVDPVALNCSHSVCKKCADDLLMENRFSSQALHTTFSKLTAHSDDAWYEPGSPWPVRLASESPLQAMKPVLTCPRPECRAASTQLQSQSGPDRALRPLGQSDNYAATAKPNSKNIGIVVQCDFCDQSARVCCTICSVAYCKDHTDHHPRKFQEHTMIPAAHLKSSKKEAAPSFECQAHREKFKLWCKNHQVLVCSLCARFGEHKSCACQTLETLDPEAAKLNKLRATELKILQKEITTLKLNLQKSLEQVQASSTVANLQIQHLFDVRSMQLAEEQRALLAATKRVTSERLALASSQVKSLKLIEDEVRMLLKQADEAVGPQVQLVVTSRLNSYLSSLAKFKVLVPHQVEVKLAKSKLTFLGKIVEKEQFDCNSLIVTSENAGAISSWHNSQIFEKWLPNAKKFVLLYKATADGWSSEIFHSKCDNKGPTVTFCRNSSGFTFGGYSAQSWESSGGGKNDVTMTSFLFSLADGKKDRPPFKCDLVPGLPDTVCSTYCSAKYGPVFGWVATSGRCDLMIHLNEPKTFASQNSFGNSGIYLPSVDPTQLKIPRRLFTLLTGAKQWTLEEVEVYGISNEVSLCNESHNPQSETWGNLGSLA
eukprot:gb/GEZN01003441.1/.p1 GENE.gb/GEZN01003441.1/~~gb/GEZN01003441.1/.p1  ORF type:complete len:672 (+),score=55.08 gb/GEZN01003441.1/:210-2018(+)